MKKKLYYLIAGVAMLFSACDKDKGYVENTEYERLTPGDPKYSYIKILNLSPGSPVVNFYMDGTKFSSKLSSTGVENAGYTYNQVFPDLGYAIATPGARTLTGKIIPTATADANLQVFSTNINPAPGKYYTIIPNGAYNTSTKTIPSTLVLEDVRPLLDTTKVIVRFANVLSGGPTMSLIRGTAVSDPKIINNVAVNTASDWVEISSPGGGPNPSLSFLFVDAATNVALGTALTTTSLTKGRAYTLYVRGISGAASPNNPIITFYTTFY
ncbi:DUF4397 domain-containing protein [Pedobacter helvus]|uniref:DUF4397 domain-containing protein n=1 Tax=Pedobacter helvus TaxID=2563444 RepID=A0ABW9JKD4_9SPHI|nr:DUF4397 domain-containing protein [Pedobacter ureilyticus]